MQLACIVVNTCSYVVVRLFDSSKPKGCILSIYKTVEEFRANAERVIGS